MLSAFKNAELLTSPDGKVGGYYASLGAWKYAGDTEANDDNFTVRRLEESAISDWASQRGVYSSRAKGNSTSNRKLEGGIRLLFSQPRSSFRQKIPEGLDKGHILEALGLPQCSFASFQLSSGVFSLHTVPEGSTIDTCAQLGLVFRTPQKAECSTGGLSLCHDVSTGITTALILGYSFSLEKSTSELPPDLNSFLGQLEEDWAFWDHPLLLPSTFLISHTLNVRSYIYKTLNDQVMTLERRIGVTKAGRPDDDQFDAWKGKSRKHEKNLFFSNERGEQQMQRAIAKTLTASINDLSTSILFAKRSPTWDMDCSKFLARLITENKRLVTHGSIPGHQLEQTLEYVHSYSEALAEVTETLQARLRLQLNILYTAIVQDDGQASARLATSAGKDSTSMKILALITAAYLPGTFVASFFSMGMFDWSAGSYGSVNKSFWVYWAVALPLTIITLTCWGFWWRRELDRFDRDVNQQGKTPQDGGDQQVPKTTSDEKGPNLV